MWKQAIHADTASSACVDGFIVCVLQEAEGGALASFTGTMRYSSGLIADQKRTAAALVRVSKMMSKVGCVCGGGGGRGYAWRVAHQAPGKQWLLVS